MGMFVVIIALCLGTAIGAFPPTDDEIDAMWARYQREHSSHHRHFNAFKKNVLKAHDMNLEHGIECADFFDGPECTFGITKYFHMSEDEFKVTVLGGYKPSTDVNNMTLSAPLLSTNDMPEAANVVDWRAKGAVTPVKNQGECGSCWAFSITQEIESAHFMATGNLPILSTQQVISCDKQDGGCEGGMPETGYAYVKKAGGIDTAKDYPDHSHISGKREICRKQFKKAVKISGFKYAVKSCQKGKCNQQDEDGLAKALATKGPISICVNAEPWQYYRRGIVTKKQCSGAAAAIDHCVQLVGYNKAGPAPYWIVKNSWAKDWGMDGYIHLKMGDNVCGLANEATIVEMQKDDLLVV